MIETENPIVSPLPTRDAELAQVRADSASSDEDGTPMMEILIRPQTGWIPIDWKELYAYRELLFFFVWRDISARYKQTVLGSAWAVIQPLMTMGIFVIVAKFVKISTPQVGGVELPYPVFV